MKLFGKELNPIVIEATLILMFLATLFCPFVKYVENSPYQRSWEFLFNPPSYKSIDIPTLLVEYVLILFFMGIVDGIVDLFLKDKENSKSE